MSLQRNEQVVREKKFIVAKSGLIEYLENINRMVNQVVSKGFRSGIDEVLRLFIPELAKETGLFRRAVDQSIREAIVLTDTGGGVNISINIKTALLTIIGRVPYAIEHIDGAPYHPGATRYINPTEEGTKPFNTQEFHDVAYRFIKRNIALQARSVGLEFNWES